MRDPAAVHLVVVRIHGLPVAAHAGPVGDRDVRLVHGRLTQPECRQAGAETVRTYKSGNHREILIAVGADAGMMARVDGMAGLHTVIAVPKKEGALAGWAETWSPLIPGAKKRIKEKVSIDPVIADALSALAVGINLSVHGLAVQDRKQVENMIRLLKQNKHQEKPANIRAWAVGHGWHPETADELVKIWEEVYGLKSASIANSRVDNTAPITTPSGGGLVRTVSRRKGALPKKGAEGQVFA
ncbi:MAG: hypothetical protein R6W72_06780 [Desulfurivibrionaceae bacterium]